MLLECFFLKSEYLIEFEMIQEVSVLSQVAHIKLSLNFENGEFSLTALKLQEENLLLFP